MKANEVKEFRLGELFCGPGGSYGESMFSCGAA